MRNSLMTTLALALAIATPATAQTNLVINGGFETGGFAGWTQGGTSDFSQVIVSAFAHSGDHEAEFGPLTVGTLTQLVETTAGTEYLFSFWLDNDAPGFFQALWNGSSQLILTNATLPSYTLYSFDVVASGSSTPIEFQFTNQEGFWYLDDVSVQLEGDVVPEPATMTLLATGLAGMAAARRRKRTAS